MNNERIYICDRTAEEKSDTVASTQPGDSSRDAAEPDPGADELNVKTEMTVY